MSADSTARVTVLDSNICFTATEVSIRVVVGDRKSSVIEGKIR